MSLLLANWRSVLAISLFAIYSAVAYRIGGNGPRSELAALKAAATAQNAHTAAIDTKTTEIAHEAAKTASDAFAAIDKHYSVPRVRKPADSSQMPQRATVASGIKSEAAPSVPDPIQQCTDRDSAHDAEQVILLQAFYEDLRSAQK